MTARTQIMNSPRTVNSSGGGGGSASGGGAASTETGGGGGASMETGSPSPAGSVRRTCLLMCLLAMALMSSVGCWSQSAEEAPVPGLRKVRLQLNWVPEAEHGGFYTAKLSGFYEQAGLDVEIIPGGVSAPVLQQIEMQRVEFGVINGDKILLGRKEDANVKAVMSPIQNSPRCVLVRPEVGATSFQDLRDLTLSAQPNETFLAFMKQALPLENVRLVPYQSMQGFFTNSRYAQQGYSFSEPYLARVQGIEPTVLMLSELGFNPYTSCLVTSEKLIAADPALVRQFTQASIRGWEKYLSDPSETNLKIAELNVDQSPASLAFALEDIRRLCDWNPETKSTRLPIGSMSAERFQELGEQMKSLEFLQGADDSVYREAFTTEFLPEPLEE